MGLCDIGPAPTANFMKTVSNSVDVLSSYQSNKISLVSEIV